VEALVVLVASQQGVVVAVVVVLRQMALWDDCSVAAEVVQVVSPDLQEPRDRHLDQAVLEAQVQPPEILSLGLAKCHACLLGWVGEHPVQA
jgi:hypothetical protein